MGKPVASVGNLQGIYTDPTLEAIHRAVEKKAAREPARGYLGASSLGHRCERASYYQLHSAPSEPWKSSTLYKFADGHATEALMIERLRMVQGVQVWDRDEHTGEQIGGKLHDGKFGWHVDGVVVGLLQAPKTPHVLEIKATAPDNFKKFLDSRTKYSEKQALQNWNYIYWVQAQIYCGMLDLDRHYIIVATPGGREFASARTEFVPVMFKALMQKAERIIAAREEPIRVMDDPSYFLCKMCQFRKHCHNL